MNKPQTLLSLRLSLHSHKQILQPFNQPTARRTTDAPVVRPAQPSININLQNIRIQKFQKHFHPH